MRYKPGESGSPGTMYKPGVKNKGKGKQKESPLTSALVSQLSYVPDSDKALGFDEATRIIRQLIKIATNDNPGYYSYCIQAAKELRELGYSRWGKPTQPIDTGFDLGGMIAGIQKAMKESK
jgi:hypothetical protein